MRGISWVLVATLCISGCSGSKQSPQPINSESTTEPKPEIEVAEKAITLPIQWLVDPERPWETPLPFRKPDHGPPMSHVQSAGPVLIYAKVNVNPGWTITKAYAEFGWISIAPPNPDPDATTVYVPTPQVDLDFSPDGILGRRVPAEPNATPPKPERIVSAESALPARSDREYGVIVIVTLTNPDGETQSFSSPFKDILVVEQTN